MVDNDEYCIDILTQISAATRALQACPFHYCTDSEDSSIFVVKGMTCTGCMTKVTTLSPALRTSPMWTSAPAMASSRVRS